MGLKHALSRKLCGDLSCVCFWNRKACIYAPEDLLNAHCTCKTSWLTLHLPSRPPLLPIAGHMTSASVVFRDTPTSCKSPDMIFDSFCGPLPAARTTYSKELFFGEQRFCNFRATCCPGCPCSLTCASFGTVHFPSRMDLRRPLQWGGIHTTLSRKSS